MKKYLSLVLMVLFGLHSFAAGQWVKVTSSTPSKPVTALVSSDNSQTVIHLSVDGFWKSEVQTPQGSAWLIDLGNSVRNLEQGAPDLPYVSTSLIIPDLSKMKVEIVSASYQDFENVLIAPSKGNLYRNVNQADVPYIYGDVYQKNSNYPGRLSKLNDPYIVRDYRGAALWMYPFQYNPVTKTLRVYYDMELKVSTAGVAEINPLNRKAPLDKIDSRFYKIYKSHFLNFQTSSRYDPVDEHGNMLIISYGDFMDEMDPFITWKTQTGTHVDIVDVATIGGAPAIKQYVADYYNDNGLTFLMLIGDAAQVPTSNAGGNDSDNDYTYVVGNDHYPDLFCGRFSAENDDQVTTQVDRMIDYEKNPQMADTTWYTQSLGIASNQGTGDDNEYDWEHIRNIQENKLLPYTYTYDYELYDGSHGGNDADGNPTAQMVSDAVNDGVTIINYCGHGSNTSWGTTGFSNSDVNNLTNANKLPFIFDVACVNGNFKNHTCFAEAWMRAEDSFGNPTGAITVIMSTINQSWNPPMCGQDAMNDIMVETYPDNIKRTFGGVAMNGCMEMNDTYGSQGVEMTDTWTIFGDPSLMLRTAVPQELTVTHPAKLSVGDAFMTISCPVDGAVATLSMNGEILGSATVSGGSATIFFDPPLANTGDADFVVVAYNYIPYIATIPITSGSAPFIEYVDNVVNDSLGNNNQQVDYAEDIFLDLYFTNSGDADAVDMVADISTINPYVTLTDTSEGYGTVLQQDTVDKWNGYRFTVADTVPDMEEIDFSVVAHDTSDQTWNMNFTLVAHAPVLQYVNYEIIDTTGNGNGNGRLDAGETAEMKVFVTNAGSADAFNVTTVLSDNDWVSVEDNTQSAGSIVAGDTVSVSYIVTADGDTPSGYLAWFDLDINADFNRGCSARFSTTVGQKPVVIIRLAPTLTADSLEACFEELSISVDLDTVIPDNLDDYDVAFVLLGTFSTNHILTDDEGVQLADYLDNGGNLYMEGGDTWAVDTATQVHPMFNIEGLNDGTDDLYNPIGTDGTFMEGFTFEYVGANNYIDHIAPIDKAFTILTNNMAGYDVAVANSGDNYRTIGASFEFGGLLDNQYCNKTGYLAEMLSFFGVSYVWTGINDVATPAETAKVYPNPFGSVVYFDLGSVTEKTASLTIYDLQGRVVYSEVVNTMGSKTVHFSWDAAASGVKQGVYFYRLASGNNLQGGKVVYSR